MNGSSLRMVYFPYWMEIFILAKLCGVSNASWWWVAVFIVLDGCALKSYERRKAAGE